MARQGKAILCALGLGTAAVLAGSTPAGAGPPPKALWATVNICDTFDHPNQMGVRASMPAGGRRQRMYMRFHAEFYNPAKKEWFKVKGSGVSRWIYVGSGRRETRQAGYTFSFMPPKPGATYVLRGVVDFQWRVRRRRRHHRHRRRTVVVRTLHANTKGEHPADGADPPGYSSGTCEIRS